MLITVRLYGPSGNKGARLKAWSVSSDRKPVWLSYHVTGTQKDKVAEATNLYAATHSLPWSVSAEDVHDYTDSSWIAVVK